MGAIQLAVGENGRIPFANENIDRSPEAVHWRAATNDVIQGMSAADVQRFNEANRDSNPRLQIRDMTPAERQEHINHNPGQNYQRILDVSMRNGTGQYIPTDSIPEVAMHGTGQHSSAR